MLRDNAIHPQSRRNAHAAAKGEGRRRSQKIPEESTDDRSREQTDAHQ